jgi:hypothetical protein
MANEEAKEEKRGKEKSRVLGTRLWTSWGRGAHKALEPCAQPVRRLWAARTAAMGRGGPPHGLWSLISELFALNPSVKWSVSAIKK